MWKPHEFDQETHFPNNYIISGNDIVTWKFKDAFYIKFVSLSQCLCHLSIKTLCIGRWTQEIDVEDLKTGNDIVTWKVPEY